MDLPQNYNDIQVHLNTLNRNATPYPQDPGSRVNEILQNVLMERLTFNAHVLEVICFHSHVFSTSISQEPIRKTTKGYEDDSVISGLHIVQQW